MKYNGSKGNCYYNVYLTHNRKKQLFVKKIHIITD